MQKPVLKEIKQSEEKEEFQSLHWHEHSHAGASVENFYTGPNMAMQEAVQKEKKWPEGKKEELQFLHWHEHGRVGASADPCFSHSL